MSESSQSDLGVIRPDWIKQLNSASEREVAEVIGLKLVKEEVRCVVWDMANNLHCRLNGVPGRACRLLERYFYFLFRSYKKISREAERIALLESVMSRLMLIIACCVQLSAKMESADTCLSPKVVRVALLCKGIPCTVSEIVKTEAEVYSVLGFRIPLWTSVHISEQLANEIGISSTMMKDVAFIADMAEFLKNDIERKMKWAATGSSNTSDGISTVHLSAGAVLVAARLEPFCSTQQTTITTSETESASAKKLAHLVNAPLPYITCLADVIFEAIWHKNEINKSTPLILKRKINN